MTSIVPITVNAPSFFVAVLGWGSPRMVVIHENEVFFQAATCYPCSICDRRVEELEGGIKRSGLGDGTEKRQLDQLLFFVVPLPELLRNGTRAEEALAHLSKLFDLEMEMIIDASGEPVLLPMKKEVYSAVDCTDIVWDASHCSGHLTIRNESRTLEWEDPSPAIWLPAQTAGHLGCGSFSVEFKIESMGERQIGVGFLLAAPDWGFFGYLGASETAWYPLTGAIVNNTRSVYSDLPTFKEEGVIRLDLDLISGQRHKAQFVVNGVATPEIELPEDCVVIPAGCLLAQRQKVTLQNFTKNC